MMRAEFPARVLLRRIRQQYPQVLWACSDPFATGRILLAKSLQGDKCNLYCALWLSLTGRKSCFCSVWHHDASRISRKGSASANSPAVSPGSLGVLRPFRNRTDTAGEITTRRQMQPVLCIMVELDRAKVLFLFSLAP